MKRILAICAVACASFLPGLSATAATSMARPRIAVKWAGNFDTGNFDQWARRNFVAGDAKIVRSVRRQGGYAARFIVHPGDIPAGLGERAEVGATQRQTGGYAGVSTYYGWSTYFPQNFHPVRDTWNIFAQWHSTRSWLCGPGPNVSFNARLRPTWRRPRYEIRVSGGRITPLCRGSSTRVYRLGPIALSKWNDFAVHVKWSAAHEIGYVEAWINGRKVVPLTHIATLYHGYGAYLQQGLYRGPGQHTSTLFQDAMRRGPTLASVTPSRHERARPR